MNSVSTETAAICLLMAAGEGERFGGGLPKQFRELLGKPMVIWSLEKMARSGLVERIVAVVPTGYEKWMEQAAADFGIEESILVIAGGGTRQESVRKGLESLSSETGKLLVHDAVRPCFTEGLLSRVVEELEHNRAVVPIFPSVDTLYKDSDGHLDAVIDRVGIARAQTPQGFDTEALARAHRTAHSEGVEASDDGTIVFYARERVRLVQGESTNIKITYPEDLAVAEAILRTQGG